LTKEEAADSAPNRCEQKKHVGNPPLKMLGKSKKKSPKAVVNFLATNPMGSNPKIINHQMNKRQK